MPDHHARACYKSHHITCVRKALPGFFLCIFSSLTCLKKPVFSERDLVQWKVPASLSLFLNSEKIPALEKDLSYRPFRDFRPVLSAYQPRAQISNQWRACTRVLLLNHFRIWVFFLKREKENWYVYCTRQPSILDLLWYIRMRQGSWAGQQSTGILSIVCNSPSFFVFCWWADCRRIVCLATSSEDRSIAALATFVSIIWGLRTHRSGGADW
jgi:hypothetical protein